MRKALEGRGLQDVKVEPFAFLSRCDSPAYFVSLFGIMMDVIMNTCWSEELRKEHPKEEVLKLLQVALEKKYGSEGWDVTWVALVASGRVPSAAS
jgi:hypothetical protein